MYNNFFIDLMQLSSLNEPTRVPTDSPQLQEPSQVDISGQTRAAIQNEIQKITRSISFKSSKRTSLSLVHNFLKYAASMEHLAFPDSPFWCPT